MYIEKIIVVGGGTSGWMTAYWMRRLFPDIKITAIVSEEIDILGAGEGGLPIFFGWFKQTGIDLKEFFQYTGATVKLGIDYRDWYAKGSNFLHPFTGDLLRVGDVSWPTLEESPKPEEQDEAAKLIWNKLTPQEQEEKIKELDGEHTEYVDLSDENKELIKDGVLDENTEDIMHEYEEDPDLEIRDVNKHSRRAYVNRVYNEPELNFLEWASPFMHDGIPDESLEDLMKALSDNQMSGVSLHFDAIKVGEFFKEKCVQEGVLHIPGTVIDIEKTAEGMITGIITDDQEKHECDFVFDCSGERRVISSKFEEDKDWWPFPHLTLNSALPFNLENEKDIGMWTAAQAMDCGWMWQIPLQNRIGCGYVFDDRFIDYDYAQQEVEKFLGKKINPIKPVSFKSGYLEKPWAYNCISMGMSQSFVEPLEATALGSLCVQHFILRDIIYALVEKFEEKRIEDFTNWPEINWDEGDYSIAQLEYNALCGNIIREIADFVHCHYYTPRKDTDFWESRQELFNMNQEEFTGEGESMSHKLKVWKDTPVYYQPETEAQQIYNEFNLICVFDGLNIYDRKERQKLMANYPYLINWMSDQNFEDWKEIFQEEKLQFNNGRLKQFDYLKKYEYLTKT